MGARSGMTFRWRTFGVALVCVTAMMAIAWSSFFPPFYLENDDVAIRMALEGRTVPGGAPTGFALWPNSVLGWFVVLIERVLPSIVWWDVVLAAALLWALGVLLSLVWDALGRDWLARTTAVTALVVAMAPLIASFQFTISAVLAGGAATLLTLIEVGAARPRRTVLTLAILLFTAGLLIRPMGAAAGALVAASLCLPFVRTRKWWTAHLLGVVGIVGVFYLAAQYVDAELYGMDAEWDRYLRYNQFGGPLVDWGSDLSTTYGREIQQSAGWSPNDWLMLYRALGVDPVVHSFDRVSQAYETQTAILSRLGVLPVLFNRARSYPLESLRNLFNTSAFVVIAGGLLVGAYGTRRAVAQVAAVVLLFWAICVAFDLTFQRLPWRLLGPLQVIFVAAMVVTIGASRRVASPVLSILALSGMLAITAPVLAAEAREAGSRVGRSQEIDGELVELQRSSPSLLIFWGSRFPREYWWRPFHRPGVGLPAVTIGWNNQNPQVLHFLADTGRQPLLRALCRDPSILIVADRDPLGLVTTYMHEHFDTAVQWTQVYEGSFPAWRCSTMKGHPSETP